jgi:hypothetical protein
MDGSSGFFQCSEIVLTGYQRAHLAIKPLTSPMSKSALGQSKRNQIWGSGRILGIRIPIAARFKVIKKRFNGMLNAPICCCLKIETMTPMFLKIFSTIDHGDLKH